jgi:nucleoside-diphosphate-sugar epimerase
MDVLVTGGLGNVGSATLRELRSQGHTITCLDIPIKKNRRVSKGISDIKYIWGDITDEKTVNDAVAGQDAIIHLAAILPPVSDTAPKRAHAVNVVGTQNILTAAAHQAQSPKLIFSSSFDLFGPTQDQEPPRKITDPVVETDVYSRTKIECERIIKTSALTWSIYRFADVPPMEARQFNPIMYRIPLEQRFEVVHPADVALALANGLHSDIWGKTWLIGGGEILPDLL